jgi:hypothetical protein
MSHQFVKLIFIFLASGLLLFTGCRHPEPEEPNQVRRKSPIAIAKVTHDQTDTYIKIVYGQPYKRDRQIFGNIVPYDQVWRTGANEATELTTTRDIILGGEKLKAGTYTLFSIPRKNDNWTIILNSELGQWGAFDYNKANDVLRVNTSVLIKETVTEAFSIQFSEVENDSTNIVMRWDQKIIKIPVEFIHSDTKNS